MTVEELCMLLKDMPPDALITLNIPYGDNAFPNHDWALGPLTEVVYSPRVGTVELFDNSPGYEL